MSKKNNTILAKDCKCIKCGKQAVAFYPCFDPDIPSNPYCRECLDKTKIELLIKLNECFYDNKEFKRNI
jgi:hypothetical protein